MSPKKDLYSTCIHESGHAIMLAVFDTWPQKIEVYKTPQGGLRGQVDAGRQDALEPWQRITVAYAGPVGKYLYNQGHLHTGKIVHYRSLFHRMPLSRGDEAQANHIFAEQVPAGHHKPIFDWSLRFAVNHLTKNRRVVLALADQLVKQNSLNADEFIEFLCNQLAGETLFKSKLIEQWQPG